MTTRGRTGPGLDLSAEELSDLSDGLRSPLTAVLSYADLLGGADPALDAAAGRTLEAIQRNAARQCRLLDNLATLADLQMGMVPRVRKFVDISHLLERRLPGGVAAELAESGTELLVPAISWPPATPLATAGDAERIWHAVRELVRNAIAASPRGARVGVLSAGTGSWASIEITDSGRGVPADELDGIFQPFARTRWDQERGTAGTGLGLAAADGVIRAHGGELELRANPVRGMRAVIRLPRAG
jgi:signal transduction histidine kinase